MATKITIKHKIIPRSTQSFQGKTTQKHYIGELEGSLVGQKQENPHHDKFLHQI